MSRVRVPSLTPSGTTAPAALSRMGRCPFGQSRGGIESEATPLPVIDMARARQIEPEGTHPGGNGLFIVQTMLHSK
ncbi:hypothetical protein MPRM_04090 [Mycobacterium parmense]|uniref:Uncharacterized protein n=1 Tax=Mycobacterium parmense TaxID=185642 RepID=A0A7I7YMN3_9MYCO|nr:hypothetical protein MPRM_04090 [Mycobacterium parmense]